MLNEWVVSMGGKPTEKGRHMPSFIANNFGGEFHQDHFEFKEKYF